MTNDDVRKIVRILLAKFAPKKIARSKPWPTLIATILSSQTTDKQVDIVMPNLLAKYPTPSDLKLANQNDVEKIIKSVGLYRMKARNVIAAARIVSDEFSSKVPGDRKNLQRIAGVGRKVANVVMIKSFDKQAMPVDTHVFRVSRRIGLAKGQTPEKVENDLLKILPQKHLARLHFAMIFLGRRLCDARKPACEKCPLSGLCKFSKSSKARR